MRGVKNLHGTVVLAGTSPVTPLAPQPELTIAISPGTCYDMATYPCIYVYDAPGINPAA